mgnify:CR=1 FL=1
MRSLRGLKPSLVYCSVTGFGQDGPKCQNAAYDFAIQAMGGLDERHRRARRRARRTVRRRSAFPLSIS